MKESAEENKRDAMEERISRTISDPKIRKRLLETYRRVKKGGTK